MTESRVEFEWNRTAHLMWMIYQRHRQKREQDKKPDDFNPMKQKQTKRVIGKKNMHELLEVVGGRGKRKSKVSTAGSGEAQLTRGRPNAADGRDSVGSSQPEPGPVD